LFFSNKITSLSTESSTAQFLRCTAVGANGSCREGSNRGATIESLLEQITAVCIIVALVFQAVDEGSHGIEAKFAQAFDRPVVGEDLLAVIDDLNAVHGASLEYHSGNLAVRVPEIVLKIKLKKH